MPWYEAFDKWTKDYLPGMTVLTEEPLSKYTSFRIGGPARRMAFPATPEEMVVLCGYAEEQGLQPLVIGNGTNMLIADEGLDRLVISTRKMEAIEEVSEGVLCAGAGVSLARLATMACEKSWDGLAFAHGIPGSVGGAVAMNAGAYGGEMKDVVSRVAVLFPDGVRYFNKEEMDFSYRHSLLSEHPEAIVLYAEFTLAAGEREAIRAAMQELMAKRKEKQPLEYPSGGSFFKRPAGNFAGALIEQAGLKGFTVGGAQVSEKHAGFVINVGGATCADVLALMAEVMRRVEEAFGVVLEPEVKIIEK